MSTSTLGDGVFRDLFVPVKGKTDWGVDTLTRKLSGSRSGAQAFIATLAQSQGAGVDYPGYFLQSWEPDENPTVATVTLNYKGLLTGGTPTPNIERQIVSASGTKSKSYALENDGKGRIYRNEVLYTYQYTNPVTGVPDTATGIREIYAVSATLEFTYKAYQTRYRYIKVGEPSGPQYSDIGVTPLPTLTMQKSRIITSDGAILGIQYLPLFQLTPDVIQTVVSFSANNVIGSPFWECEDIVRLELGDADNP